MKLKTLQSDEVLECDLSASTITLPPGTYVGASQCKIADQEVAGLRAALQTIASADQSSSTVAGLQLVARRAL